MHSTLAYYSTPFIFLRGLYKHVQFYKFPIGSDHTHYSVIHFHSCLQVLELSLNAIVSLESLDKNPPPQLTHLGVSYNRLTCLNLTPAKWSVERF